MKNSIIALSIFVALFLQGCGLDAVENPNVTTDKFLDSPQSATNWVNGSRSQMASTINVIIELTELTSDNYYNNRTISSKVFDIPQIDYTDLDVGRIQSAIHSLRRTADFGLNTVLPKDTDSTPEQEAELKFYLAVSQLFSGEYFEALPNEALGAPLSSETLLGLANTTFDEVISLAPNSDFAKAALIGKARIAFHLNSTADLRTLATSVINNTPQFTYQVQFDGINGPSNSFQNLLFDSSQDEFAPLPRLDFLDPKYFSIDGAGISQIPVNLFKSEEAYLMLAELELKENGLASAQPVLVDLLNDVIANRDVTSIDDSRETRSGGNRTDYPLSDTVKVRFSQGEPALDDFVLDRQDGNVSIPTVSGTSVTVAQINNAATVDELLEIIYLMRQEIFIAEGRRVVDLGIKYPISQQEQAGNTNISDNSPYLDAIIPNFIPLSRTMDDFTVDEAQGIVTIAVNMNNVLVQNKNSDFVLPLW
ncbi:MAG: tetratricopeptide repeat protein [Balneola sp.]